ncbi:MAG TPA: hypothetical protein VLX92_02960 [Kofleriaceae bacterium]|nr:hypothetical protein [Kofleriaceae bacterium]
MQFRSYIIVLVSTAALAIACGSSSNKAKPDAAADASADAFASSCGEPGDTGNELGIGKFCQMQSDCSGTQAAPLCSIIGDSTTHFCTKICTSTGSADQCGTATTCTCNSSNECGCTPNKCLGM